MSRPHIRLACLDMAGTTVRDDGIVEVAFSDAVHGLGIEPGTPRHAEVIEHVRATMGQPKISVFRTIFAGDEELASDADRRFEAAYGSRVAAGQVAPLPGAREAIDSLRDAGVLVCLTTGFSTTTRDALLDVLGWRDAVDLVLAPSEAGRGRPFPDMILTAILRLQVDDVRAVAVAGDTASDLEAGHRAGAGIVAGVLTGAHDRATLAAAPHTHLLASIADLPPLVY